jgi:SAM-dependent methyltransferase
MTMSQPSIDADNAAFWSELCGSWLARSIGVQDASRSGLQRFDEAYVRYYPYLVRHLRPIIERQGATLEVGLGYGTVSGYLAQSGLDYHGLDIAPESVQLVRQRLDLLGVAGAADRVQQGSALALPWEDGRFDALVSIGCLHHTGDLAGSIKEAHRVLTPGGVAMIMIYNANSLRQLMHGGLRSALLRVLGRDPPAVRLDAYDANSAGETAPFTELTSVREARDLLAIFRSVGIVKENMSAMPRIRFPRERLLGWPARRLGLDLYITAIK